MSQQNSEFQAHTFSPCIEGTHLIIFFPNLICVSEK